MVSPALGGLLDAVVADRPGGLDRVRELGAGDWLELHAPARFGRVVRPHPGVAVGLQLGAHRRRGGPVRVPLRASEGALQVLHVVAHLVRHHVLLGEGVGARPEVGAHLLEERRVQVHGAVRRAVERAGGGGRLAARGAVAAPEQRDLWQGVRLARGPRVVVPPELVQGLHGGHHAARGVGVGIRTRAAPFGQGTVHLLRAGGLGLGAAGDSVDPVLAEEQSGEQQDHHAAQSTAHRDAAATAAGADAPGVQLGVLVEAHGGSIGPAGRGGAPRAADAARGVARVTGRRRRPRRPGVSPGLAVPGRRQSRPRAARASPERWA